MNTEEAFVLASLKEFVKLWGSGFQASLNLECRNGQAWFQLGGRLGHPALPHFCPPPPQTEFPVKRKKSPAKAEKDRARAAKHRATKKETEAAPAPSTLAATAELDICTTNLADPAGSPSASLPASPSTHSRSTSRDCIPTTDPASTTAAASAVPPTVTVTVAEEPQVSMQEAFETVHATAVIESSPNEVCDYKDIYNLVVKEHHMRNNIAEIKINHESTRQFRSNLFTHTVSIILTVKTAALWDSPRQYIWKQLGQNDWAKSNGSSIKFVKIHVK